MISSSPFFPACPSAPKDFKVAEVTRHHVHLMWEAPEHDGGSPVTYYQIEKREVSRKTWAKVRHFSSVMMSYRAFLSVMMSFQFNFICTTQNHNVHYLTLHREVETCSQSNNSHSHLMMSQFLTVMMSRHGQTSLLKYFCY